MAGDRIAVVLAALVLCSLVSVAVAWRAQEVRRVRWVTSPWTIVICALALRAGFALVDEAQNYDILHAFRLVGHQFRVGDDVYTGEGIGLATYPPLVYYWWAFADAVAPAGHDQLFAWVLRLPFWIVDGLVPLVLLRVAGPRWATRAAWLYALSPVAIAVPTLHGQFDSLLAIPVLLCLSWLPARPGRAGLVLGIAIAVKPAPVFIVPMLLALLPRRVWKTFLGAATVAPILTYAVYAALHPQHILTGFLQTLTFVPHWQGLGLGFLFYPDGLNRGWSAVFDVIAEMGVIAAAIWCRRRRVQPAEAAGLGSLCLLTLSPTVSDQYLTWPIAPLLMAGRTRLVAFLGIGLLPAIADLDLWGQALWPLLALAWVVMAGATLTMLRSLAPLDAQPALGAVTLPEIRPAEAATG